MIPTPTHRSLESVKQIAVDVTARNHDHLRVLGVTGGEANGNYAEVMVRRDDAGADQALDPDRRGAR